MNRIIKRRFTIDLMKMVIREERPIYPQTPISGRIADCFITSNDLNIWLQGFRENYCNYTNH